MTIVCPNVSKTFKNPNLLLRVDFNLVFRMKLVGSIQPSQESVLEWFLLEKSIIFRKFVVSVSDGITF